jgi:CRISPR-associated protein Cmr3
MTSAFIEPSDVWLFRDGRPFAANDQSRAASIFPPTPRTLQGVIRSARLAQSGESFDYKHWSDALKAEIGQPDNFGALKMRGPLLARRKADSTLERFFPLPADIVKLTSGWHVLSPDNRTIQANWPTGLQPLLSPSGSEQVKFEHGWLNETSMLAYLNGAQGDLSEPVNSGELFQREPRLGIGIESGAKSTVEGMLYQIEFVRLQESVGLLVEFSGVSLTLPGTLQIGGEGRAARYATSPTGLSLAQKPQLTVNNSKLRFKTYLATPAFFGQGWLPSEINSQTLSGKWHGLELQLVAAAIHKPQSIGGRDIAARRDAQRPMKRAVAAGSVYFWETSASAQEVFAAFDGQCISDKPEADIGFGLCYTGGW